MQKPKQPGVTKKDDKYSWQEETDLGSVFQCFIVEREEVEWIYERRWNEIRQYLNKMTRFVKDF